MAGTYTLKSEHRGVYEIPLLAGQPVTFEVEGADNLISGIRIIVHTSTSAVYVKQGDTVEPQDPTADMIPGQSFLQVYPPRRAKLAVVSANPAVVSVTRS